MNPEDQERRDYRAELVTRAWLVFVSVVVTASLAVTAIITVQNAQRGKENHALLSEIRAEGKQLKVQGKRIQSCTTPGQPCYQSGQKRTAGAIGSINQVSIAAAGCSLGVTGSPRHRIAVIQACVHAQLFAHTP